MAELNSTSSSPRLNPSPTDATRTPNDLLKSWYLANLRRTAVQNSPQLTPAALINADKQHLENLVLSHASEENQRSYPFAGAFEDAVPIWLMAIVAIFAIAAVVTHLLGGWLIGLGLVSVGLTAGCGIMSIFAILMLYNGTREYLHRIGHVLATAVQRPLTGAPSLVKAAQELAMQRDELAEGEQLIVQATPDLLCCIDEDGNVQAVNKCVWTLLGYTPEELQNRPMQKFVLPEDAECIMAYMETAKRNKRATEQNLRFLSKRGSARDFKCTVEWSDTGRLFFLLGEDISDRKMIERMRLEFVSTMGHDIKIPLSSAWTCLQMLQEQHEQGDARQRELLHRAENNIEHLIGLIDELLLFEKAESGSLPLSVGMVATKEVIEDAIDAIKSQAETKRIAVHAAELANVTIEADEKKLTRLITNLLSNAIKFAPIETGIDVTSTVESGLFEVRVRDRGPGIPQAYQQLIFERYERLPSSEPIEGTGLGLSICKQIVEAHAGMIGVDSPGDGGSEFWFTLPVRRPV